MEENKEVLETREQPVHDPKVEGLKVKTKAKKTKPKQLAKKKNNEPVKFDLNKKEDNAVQKPETESSVLREEKEEPKEQVELQSVGQEVQEEEEVTIIEEVVSEEKKEITSDTKEKYSETLPDNVNKLLNFMQDTGGTIEDYVRLNADYSNVDPISLLKEYYKNTKPHLNEEEVNFVLNDKFAYDEDYDDEKDIRKKKLAIKEEVAKAKGFLNDLKDKYYDEIKMRSNVNPDQQKALDFFNRYNKEQEVAKKNHEIFVDRTKNHFSDEFKGFEFNLGDKRFRYKVNNPSDVANKQSNINDFIKTFLNEDGSVGDLNGYHKAMYAARNIDKIANHFYEQGKADAVKDVIADSKNINTKARVSAPSDGITFNGMKIKSVSGVDSSKLRITKKK
jgi:hypothetical protein